MNGEIGEETSTKLCHMFNLRRIFQWYDSIIKRMIDVESSIPSYIVFFNHLSWPLSLTWFDYDRSKSSETLPLAYNNWILSLPWNPYLFSFNHSWSCFLLRSFHWRVSPERKWNVSKKYDTCSQNRISINTWSLCTWT